MEEVLEAVIPSSVRDTVSPSGGLLLNSFLVLSDGMTKESKKLMKTREDFNRIQLDDDSSTHESNTVQSPSTREARQSSEGDVPTFKNSEDGHMRVLRRHHFLFAPLFDRRALVLSDQFPRVRTHAQVPISRLSEKKAPITEKRNP